MTITAADIKLIESERMADTTDGGGRRTARVIPDGVPGNIFPKISRLDSVYGRFALRKVYGAVLTTTSDVYGGSHAIITDPPDNNRVHVTLFSTGSDFDQRSAAQDRVESYVIAGPTSRMHLYGPHPSGSKSLLAYQQPGEPIPDVGDVFALVQLDSTGATLFTQYVRVDSASSESRTFEDDRGTYVRAIVTVGLTSRLEHTFIGAPVVYRTEQATTLARILETSVADAATYYGVQPLAQAALSGDLSVLVPSIYTQIVPTTQREVPISLAQIFDTRTYVPTGATFAGSMAPPVLGATFSFRGSVLPGSISISNSASAYPISDGGDGILYANSGATQVGTVDYESGTLTWAQAVTTSGGMTYTATHAAPATGPALTKAIKVTLANRGTVYSQVMNPPPAKGTMVVDYRALGRWYRLRDARANGTLAGNSPADGSGTADSLSGAVVVTLGALPDIDSSVIFSWGRQPAYTSRTTDASAKLKMYLQLSHFPVVASTCVVSYKREGSSATQTLALDSAGLGSDLWLNAALNGQTGLLTLTFNTNVMLTTELAPILVGYSYKVASGTSAPLGQMVTRIIGTSLSLDSVVSPGSVRFPLSFTAASGALSFMANGYVSDDGAGNLVFPITQVQLLGSSTGRYANLTTTAAVTVGTINYSTGDITLSGAPSFAGVVKVFSRTAYVDVSVSLTMTRGDGGSVVFSFNGTGVTAGTGATDSFSRASTPFYIDLTETVTDPVVPGSVLFSIGVPTFPFSALCSDQDGKILMTLTSVSSEASTPRQVGTIDYVTGRATISSLVGRVFPTAGAVTDDLSSTIYMQACLTGADTVAAHTVDFRTTGSPVRVGSLYVQATGTDGATYSGTSDISGVITGTGVSGTVQQNFGVAEVTFTNPVIPSTIRYSAVVSSNVALDATLLGLDPVRLPLDGRVPIYRPGDVVVVHNTQAVTLPNPVTSSSTHSTGRTLLSDLWVVDAAGVRIDPALYTADLAAGTVTFAAGLVLTGIPQPLVARHRVEDMLPLADAQIDGTLSLGAPLTRNYDVTGTYVSSALLFGDISARYTNLFDQSTWTGVWSSTLIGSGATAEYDSITSPIEVTNAGAITERWRLSFTSTTAFQVIGEHAGVIATGTTSADCAPTSPLTGLPYFVIRAAGWNTGWSVGNNLRFDTLAGGVPFWLARTILPGAALTADSTDLQFRGDVDA